MDSAKGYSLAATERVLDLAEAGASLAEIAGKLGITVTTAFAWAEEHEEFAGALLLADRMSKQRRRQAADTHT